jgi:hypothetical protein
MPDFRCTGFRRDCRIAREPLAPSCQRLSRQLRGQSEVSWGEVGVARFWVQTPYRVHLLLRQLYTAHCSATALVSLQYEVSAQVVLSAQGPGGGAAASWA